LLERLTAQRDPGLLWVLHLVPGDLTPDRSGP